MKLIKNFKNNNFNKMKSIYRKNNRTWKKNYKKIKKIILIIKRNKNKFNKLFNNKIKN